MGCELGRNSDPGTTAQRWRPVLTTTSRRDFMRYSAIAGAGLLGSVLLVVALVSLVFR